MTLGEQPKVGERLSDARSATGVSRERVARQLDPPVSSKTLERWERGDNVPGRWRLEQLAEIYGVPVSSLNGKAA